MLASLLTEKSEQHKANAYVTQKDTKDKNKNIDFMHYYAITDIDSRVGESSGGTSPLKLEYDFDPLLSSISE